MFAWSRLFLLRTLQGLLFAIIAVPLLAQAPVQEAQLQATANSTPPIPSSASVKLSPGDLIEVSVFGVADLSTKARIGNSGDVYFPLIDYVHVADLTVNEAQELIEKRLQDGGFVRSPHVSIFVDESAAQAISILGEVGHPGPQPAVGERRLYDVLSAAGGLTERAGRTLTVIHRDHPDQKTEIHLPVNLADGTDANINVEIRPGDTIIIPRAGIVYVVGDVQHPSGIIIEDGSLSVLKAFALAGGGTHTSSLNGAKILRETPNGMKEIPVHLKKVIQAKAPDLALVKGDVLFVPGSSIKDIGYRTANTAQSLGTAVGLIALHP